MHDEAACHIGMDGINFDIIDGLPALVLMQAAHDGGGYVAVNITHDFIAGF